MSHSVNKDIGFGLQVAGGVSFSKGATGETEFNGDNYDRRAGQDLQRNYHGAMAVLAGTATLQSGTTLAFIGNYQHGDTTGAYTDLGDALASTIVATGPSGGGAVSFEVKFPSLDLSKAKRFVRFQATPAFSATDTDTCAGAGVIVVGGADQNPAL